MDGRTKIDVALLLDGYLSGPDGGCRYVPGLAEIAELAKEAGARLYWDTNVVSDHDAVGYCYCWSRVILLAPWLYKAMPWFVKEVISHEIAHCFVGVSHEKVEEWQRVMTPDIANQVMPEPIVRWP